MRLNKTHLLSTLFWLAGGFSACFGAEELDLEIKLLGAPSLWGKVDIELTGKDAKSIQGFAELITPSGMSYTAQFYRDNKNRVRARMPIRASGRHTISVSASTTGRYRYLEKIIDIDQSAPIREPIIISKTNPRMFSYISGKQFYSVGANVAWAKSIPLYERYFSNLSRAGVNTVRIWLAPWSLSVADNRQAGGINLTSAEMLEKTLDLASKHGLVVQLVFAYHGEFIDRWSVSPWNADNGGPCKRPSDFFSSKKARAKFRKLIEYVAVRFGPHEALFAWELFNEVDLVPDAKPREVISWHREMANYLRKVDIAKRPITTSVAKFWRLARLWELPQIEFVQAHYYTPAMFDAVSEFEALLPKNKPAFIGEFGGSHINGIDDLDKSGTRLLAMLWLSLASNSSGTAMPWWWDTHIDAQNLYSLWQPVAHVANKLKRDKPFRFIKRQLGDNNSVLFAQGIASSTQAVFYFYDARAIKELTSPIAPLPLGGKMEFSQLKDGDYIFEVYGKGATPLQTGSGKSSGGSLVLELAPRSSNFAIFITPQDSSKAGE